jgi:hypothetical protein
MHNAGYRQLCLGFSNPSGRKFNFTFFMTPDMAPIALILLLFWKKEAISEKMFVSLHMV